MPKRIVNKVIAEVVETHYGKVLFAIIAFVILILHSLYG